jgi:Tfp pilus assembly protein PilN
MPSINMIASRRAEKRRVEANTQKLVYGILAEFGVFLILTSLMVGHLVTTHNQSADLDDRIKSLQAKVDEIKHLQDATTALSPKIQALTEAKAQTLYWYTSFQNVADALPANTWLTNMTSSGQPDGIGPSSAKLSIGGNAINQFTVGEAMLRMNQYPNVAQVNLNVVQQAMLGTRPIVNFTMLVNLKPTVAPATGGAGNVQKS